MSRVVQISILGKISGNVNADGVIGNRITLKRMFSSDGEVLPFVSARAIKYAIRQALKDHHDSKGQPFAVDPFYEDPQATDQLRLRDSGEPDKYIDNDIFGYMVTKGGARAGEGETYKRHSPIAISYFKALRDTPIKSEFAARFPRESSNAERSGIQSNPVPFEVEVAEFVGKLNVIIYDYVGDFTKSTRLRGNAKPEPLGRQERISRLSAFLNVILTPSYILPRRTNSLSIPEYYVALICISKAGPLPVYQYLNYDHDEHGLSMDMSLLGSMFSRDDIKTKLDKGYVRFALIDYLGAYKDGLKLPAGLERITVLQAIGQICDHLFPQSDS